MLPDRTRACPLCRLRFRQAQCPTCGLKSLDLRRAADRRALAEGLARSADDLDDGKLGDLVAGYLRYGAPAVVGTAAVWGGVEDGTGGMILGALFAGFAQIVAVPVVAVGGALYLRLRRLPRRGGPPEPTARLALHDEPEPPGTLFSGVVTRVSPISSPLAHVPCAAFRLHGEAAGGLVDEAGGGWFTLSLADGRAIEIDASEAQIRAPIPRHAAPVVRADAALTRWLIERGLEPQRAPLRLGEQVVSEGDRVWVRATPETATHSEGYRDADTERLRASGANVVIHTEPPS
ncbi:MAG: hypothetical protein KF901_18880 [Myxococcales bacterium]|nr:hypothetical protein [Myxococcales bacterium]